MTNINFPGIFKSNTLNTVTPETKNTKVTFQSK